MHDPVVFLCVELVRIPPFTAPVLVPGQEPAHVGLWAIVHAGHAPVHTRTLVRCWSQHPAQGMWPHLGLLIGVRRERGGGAALAEHLLHDLCVRVRRIHGREELRTRRHRHAFPRFCLIAEDSLLSPYRHYIVNNVAYSSELHVVSTDE